MWKWTCPKNPSMIWEHHSWAQLHESLKAHEDGFKVPGFREFPACSEVHYFWDNGEPCLENGKGCHIPYVRNDEPSWSKNIVD